MPKYQCPECEAVLKRETAVEPGKKIKCPKCEVIFPAKPMREPEQEGKPKTAGAQQMMDDDDEEQGGSYAVIEDKAEEGDARKKDLHFGSLRDKFAKSKRGPAMAEMVTPSNFVMGEGILVCAGAVAGFVIALWPFIFSEDDLPRQKVQRQILFAVLSVLAFGVGGFLCYAASCMHELRHYSLAWAGCVVAAIPPVAALVLLIIFGAVKKKFWAYPFVLIEVFVIGVVKGMMALSTDEVKDGFIETIERAEELKNQEH
jgi:hypothetical protein